VVGGAAGHHHDALHVLQDRLVQDTLLSQVDALPRAVRSAIVSATASACSWISFNMNVS